MEYLPIHKQMFKCLRQGMEVIHNGGGNRQGWICTISNSPKDHRRDLVIVKLPNGKEQDYSRDWFLENFYIEAQAIREMGRIFNGFEYINKYSDYAVTAKALKHSRPVHADIKAEVEGCNVDSRLKKLEPSGNFAVFSKKEGRIVLSSLPESEAFVHAATFAERDNEEFLVCKLVAKVTPVTTVKAEIHIL